MVFDNLERLVAYLENLAKGEEKKASDAHTRALQRGKRGDRLDALFKKRSAQQHQARAVTYTSMADALRPKIGRNSN